MVIVRSYGKMHAVLLSGDCLQLIHCLLSDMLRSIANTVIKVIVAAKSLSERLGLLRAVAVSFNIGCGLG